MTYPIHAGASFRVAQTGEKPSNTLFRRTTSFCTDVYRLFSNSSCRSSMAPWRKQSNSWTPWLFFLDQGFLVEYGLDTFNTPPTGTTFRHPQNWLCRLRCLIPLRHLAMTSPLGNIFWDMHASPRITRTTKSRWLQRLFPQTANMTFATYGENNPSHVQRHALLSPLCHNSISSLYFFPFPQDLQDKRKLYIPCCH